MQQEIKDIIEKNLPAQVGQVLQKRLKEAEENEAKYETLQKDHKDLRESYNNVVNTLSQHKELDEVKKGLDQREETISKREHDIEIETLKFKLTESEKRADMVQDFTKLLVRNVDVRKQVFDAESNQVHNPNTGYMDYKNTTKSYSETKVEE